MFRESQQRWRLFLADVSVLQRPETTPARDSAQTTLRRIRALSNWLTRE